MSIPGGPGSPQRADIETIRAQALGCTACALSKGRTQVVWADGNLDSDLVFIGEAPGFHEDKQGKPFVGAAGQLLDRLLGEIGLDRGKCAIVNVLKCRPPGNRDPQPDEIDSCRPFLDAQLEHMNPKVIVTLGNFATRYILEQPIGITRARGNKFQRRGAVVIPTFHPAAALRGGRFGGMSPMDALRLDFQSVKQVLEQRPVEPEPARVGSSALVEPDVSSRRTDESASQQLGLF